MLENVHLGQCTKNPSISWKLRPSCLNYRVDIGSWRFSVSDFWKLTHQEQERELESWIQEVHRLSLERKIYIIVVFCYVS